MGMSDREIRRSLRDRTLRIIPSPGRINPGGIDLRALLNVKLGPGKQVLASTIERVELPSDTLGILHIRSSFAREGVIASLALVDPGFQGQLTISLYNAGARPVSIRASERFVQLSFFKLGKPAESAYKGRYQDSKGVVMSRRRRRRQTISKKENIGLRGKELSTD